MQGGRVVPRQTTVEPGMDRTGSRRVAVKALQDVTECPLPNSAGPPDSCISASYLWCSLLCDGMLPSSQVPSVLFQKQERRFSRGPPSKRQALIGAGIAGSNWVRQHRTMHASFAPNLSGAGSPPFAGRPWCPSFSRCSRSPESPGRCRRSHPACGRLRRALAAAGTRFPEHGWRRT